MSAQYVAREESGCARAGQSLAVVVIKSAVTHVICYHHLYPANQGCFVWPINAVNIKTNMLVSFFVCLRNPHKGERALRPSDTRFPNTTYVPCLPRPERAHSKIQKEKK